MSEIIYKTFVNIDDSNFLNKYVHFNKTNSVFVNNTIYKIIKETKHFLTFQEVKTDKELHIDKTIFNINFNYKKDVYKHFMDLLVKTSFTKKKTILSDMFIFSNISDYFLINDKLYNNYDISEFKNNEQKIKFEACLYRKVKSLFCNLDKRHITEIDDYINNNYKRALEYLRKHKKKVNEMGLFMEYLTIVIQLEINMNNKTLEIAERVYNESCPVCLSDNDDIYKSFYNCNHICCYGCFKNWIKRTCPICRADSKITTFFLEEYILN